MNNGMAAFNSGINARSDCYVVFEPDDSGPLDIQLESSVQTLYGRAIRGLVEKVCRHFDVTSGRLLIQDQGALDFVLAARIEACLKQLLQTDRNFLPELIPENRYESSKKRMRFSRLYLPGNSPKMMINAGLHKPHAVILDLEDSVLVSKKQEARLLVRNALRQVDFFGAERMVRINQLPRGLEDLEQVVAHFPHAILIPKCESADEVKQVDDKIRQIGEQAHIDRELFLIPIIESSKGIISAHEIAASADAVVALTIGLEDYTADLGVKRTFEGSESFYARSHLINVCKATGIQAIDSVFSDVGDTDGLRRTGRDSKALGFEGMGCIHPRQIAVINECYTPDTDEIEKAKKIVMAFEEASRKGIGVVSLGSKMIDPPVVERALHVLDQAVSLDKVSKDWRSISEQHPNGDQSHRP
jgi:citrate lyase subunit beta/citryl-CoA lyase